MNPVVFNFEYREFRVIPSAVRTDKIVFFSYQTSPNTLANNK